jgi:hypothetical protein
MTGNTDIQLLVTDTFKKRKKRLIRNQSVSGVTRAVNVTPAVTSHDRSQIPHDHLVMVTRLLQALMLLVVISSLPNVLTAWQPALYYSYNHYDINGNVIEI